MKHLILTWYLMSFFKKIILWITVYVLSGKIYILFYFSLPVRLCLADISLILRSYSYTYKAISATTTALINTDT